MTEAYLGNPNLYKANLQQSYTEEQVREIAKCMEDPIHFIKTYTKIVNIDEGLVPFNMYPCLLYTSPSPRDRTRSRMPSSA